MSGARRFGGAHSPGGAPLGESRGGFSGLRLKWFSFRVLGLRLAPTPLIFSAIWGMATADLFQILWSAGGWAALMLAAKLTGDGMKAQDAYDERIVARPPAFPRKLTAAALTALAVGAVAFLSGAAAAPLALFYAAVAGAAHVLAFGPDPMRAKGGAGITPVDLDRVAAKLEEAERVVEETAKAAATLRDRALEARIDRLAYAARDILKEIAEDPRDMARARRFLSVHLVGLRDATLQYANASAKGATDGLRGPYESLLADLEGSFAKTRESLMAEDQSALEIEIEVLRGRLQQEGAR